jgi:hypothetical protein
MIAAALTAALSTVLFMAGACMPDAAAPAVPSLEDDAS